MMMVGMMMSRPELTIAQGMVESKMNHHARGRHGEKGAFQVIERHWGRVPRTLRGQQKQNERIVNELLKASGDNLHGALRRYNGAGEKAEQYARKVEAATINVAILGMC